MFHVKQKGKGVSATRAIRNLLLLQLKPFATRFNVYIAFL